VEDEDAIRQMQALMQQNEEKMREMQLTPEEREKMARAHTLKMQAALEDYGLSTDEIMDRF